MADHNNVLSNVLSIVQRLQQELSQAFDADIQVILFGSQARGDATSESDIDVLAVLPDLSPSSISIALDVAWATGFDAEMVISLIPATKDELDAMNASLFFRAIQLEGVPA